ncbi:MULTISPECIES: hypothetical protein [Dictyoglomus]|uniref:Uncharacterized protein n=1 Tax=Dictyoglomus turgidum (strain DSM 6724 / Z-1310) TaxID=515635 RepID=B8DZ93_DICTD|nr:MULTISPECIES: hypothetical protein [Dictyoglomus]ACK41826.1 hypothetical protein Dtur_0536 [Dictyoglomus turgidum DSM 6724]PNV79571.1 MAG: hypothetical protein C0196_05230 [Dictyoglomus turgidum]HBU31319.1 hypothetical protein [Dictyoglomus sp.]
MKTKLILIFLLISLLLMSFSASAQQGLTLQDLLPESNKVPSWIKPGLVAVYKFQGGSGDQTSAGTGQGYQIYVITNIENNMAYGIGFDIFIAAGYPSYSSSIKPLKGVVYLDPKEVQDEVRKAQAAGFPQGMRQETGTAGNNLYYYLLESSDYQSMTRYFFVYDKNGLIQQVRILEKYGDGSSTVINVDLLGVYQTSLPSINTMPPAVKASPSYQLYSSVSLFGGTTSLSNPTPFGTTSYSLAKSTGSILTFSSQMNTSYGSKASKSYGNQYVGPFYIHPQLLKTNSILNIPQIGFSWTVAGRGQYGGILTQVQFSGSPIAQFEYDPNSGLLISCNFPTGGGMYFIAVLSR